MELKFIEGEKVLVKSNHQDDIWRKRFFIKNIKLGSKRKYATTTRDGLLGYWDICIPYKENAHLEGTNLSYKPILSEVNMENKQHGSILNKAHDIINGARQGQYGTPEDSFKLIAEKWSNYIAVQFDEPLEITPYDVAYMMFLMKLARIEGGNYVEDSFIDACGYLAIAHDIKAGEDKNEN